jgi:hypothetical protein
MTAYDVHGRCGRAAFAAAALSFQKRLLAALERGWTILEPDRPIYSHLFFDVVHQLVCLPNGGGRARGRALGP